MTAPHLPAGERTATRTLLSGVDALVRLLVLRERLDARDGLTTATFVSGYPGSPLAGVDLALEAQAETLAAARIVHRPGLNEELAAAAVWGSQMGAVTGYAVTGERAVDGVVGAWYGKTPGLDRSGDALKHANAMGAGPNGGAVVFCGDDPSAKSSTLTCDSQHTFADACIPVLVPADQQDVLDLGVHAFRMSRYAGCWVGLKIVTAVADGVGEVDPEPGRHRPPELPPLVGGRPWRHRPQTRVGPHAVPDQEALVVEHRLAAAAAYARANGLDRVVGAGPGARLGIVCAGTTYRVVLQAFADLGVDPGAVGVRILRLGMTYPLVEDTVLEFAGTVERILVVEEKRPFVEAQLRAVLHEAGSRTPVLGKRDADRRPLLSSVGELDTTAVGTALTAVLPDLARPAPPTLISLPIVALPGRPPGYCSGCPHNRSTLAPAGALVGGGVGCHGIMYFEARQQDTTTLPPTPMGAEGVPWIGLSPFVEQPHLIQNLGDGTLSHSGTLAIRASVAAGVDITFKILYNTAVAMTGGQDVTGLLDVPAMTRALEAEGVRRIVVCAEDPKRYGRRARWAPGVSVVGRDRLASVQSELQGVRGVSVIVYDQRCAAEARRLRKRGLLPTPPRRVVINEAVCEGCGDCGVKSNCLSVLPDETEFGEKRRIHDPSCNRDYSCLEGDCPSFVTLTPRRERPWTRPLSAARSAATSLRSAGSASSAGSAGATASAGPAGAGTARRRDERPVLPGGALPVPDPAGLRDGRYGIYFTGVGGTGVVTAARILADAAEGAGLTVSGLDQTGLSQKAGAVVSHLQLGTDPDALAAPTVGAGGADLYLSGDLLQAADQRHLGRVAPDRTIAVVDSALSPTATMLQGGVTTPDPEVLREAVRDRVGAERTVLVESTRIAEQVFANHLMANVVLLGAAYQRGALPLAAGDVERAVGGRGAATANAEAFAWGRWAAYDPAAVEKALLAAGGTAGADRGVLDPSPEALAVARTLVDTARTPDALEDLLVRRAAQAIDYQDVARARRFLGLVADTAGRDSAAEGWALTRAVADSWFKLLTYKDEYEVARLHLAADYGRAARDMGIEGNYKITYHLHPPTLRRLGRTTKLPAGRPYELGFQALSRMKRLRGTPLDPFGWDRDRRTERALVGEYEGLVRDVLDRPGVAYGDLVTLAASALDIKGYGPIKEEAVARWRERIAELRAGPK